MPEKDAMAELTDQHCYNHPRREAVARCPECGRFFCRECVTEHDRRMLCSQCLERENRGCRGKNRVRIISLLPAIQGLCGFVLLWYLFYLLGLTLLAIPHTFHEGTIWQSNWWGGR